MSFYNVVVSGLPSAGLPNAVVVTSERGVAVATDLADRCAVRARLGRDACGRAVSIVDRRERGFRSRGWALFLPLALAAHKVRCRVVSKHVVVFAEQVGAGARLAVPDVPPGRALNHGRGGGGCRGRALKSPGVEPIGIRANEVHAVRGVLADSVVHYARNHRPAGKLVLGGRQPSGATTRTAMSKRLLGGLRRSQGRAKTKGRRAR